VANESETVETRVLGTIWAHGRRTESKKRDGDTLLCMRAKPEWRHVSFTPHPDYRTLVIVEVWRFHDEARTARVGLLSSPEFRQIASRVFKKPEIIVEDWIDCLRSPGSVTLCLKVSEAGLKRSRLLKRECGLAA